MKLLRRLFSRQYRLVRIDIDPAVYEAVEEVHRTLRRMRDQGPFDSSD